MGMLSGFTSTPPAADVLRRTFTCLKMGETLCISFSLREACGHGPTVVELAEMDRFVNLLTALIRDGVNAPNRLRTYQQTVFVVMGDGRLTTMTTEVVNMPEKPTAAEVMLFTFHRTMLWAGTAGEDDETMERGYAWHTHLESYKTYLAASEAEEVLEKLAELWQAAKSELRKKGMLP